MLTPMRDRARPVLLVDALVFGGLGIWFLATPAAALSAVGFTLNDAAALTEARAMYGGYELGTAAFLYACAREPAWRRAGLTLAILVLGGLGLTRVIAGALTGGLTPLMWGLFFAEAAGVALNIAALVAAPRRSP